MRIIAHTKYSLKDEQMNNNYKIVAAQIINNKFILKVFSQNTI